ncbi:MAG: hypothetical protein QOE25_1082 [Actinomycetota bacterium]|nr:hypothetical protein [Actinomycetota bacterium]
MERPKDVKSYLAGLPPAARATLEKLRATILAAAPGAVDAISYSMPAFKVNGHTIVCYAAFKDHCSLFPMSMAVFDRFADQLEPFRTGKGTLQFTGDKPMPAGLVKRIVKARLAENELRYGKKP